MSLLSDDLTGTCDGSARPTYSLADLADLHIHRAAMHELTGHSSPRRAAGALMQQVLTLVTDAVVAPYVLEGRVVQVAPCELGLHLGAEGCDPLGWTGRLQGVDTAEPVRHLAVELHRLLDPIAEVSTVNGRIGRRGMANLVIDGLRVRFAHLARRSGSHPRPEWMNDLVHEFDPASAHRHRTLVVRPDDGPVVELPLPSSCCMMADRASAESCPTCPLHADDAQRLHLTLTWMRSLVHSDFVEVTGRPPCSTS